MIYENDIPDMEVCEICFEPKSILTESNRIQSICDGCGCIRDVNPKPRTTNNIEQYEAKTGLKGETNLKKRMWKHALSKAVYNYCRKSNLD